MKFNIKAILPAVLSFLNIEAFSKNDEGKCVVTEEQRQALTDAFGEDFVTAFETSLAEGDTPDPKIGEQQLQLNALTEERDQLKQELADASSGKDGLTSKIVALNQTIANQKELIAKMSNAPEDILSLIKPPKAGEESTDFDPENKEFLFGVNSPLMKIDQSRPYNLRAYAAIMERRGINIPTAVESSMDYSTLKDDLGDFYRIRKQDRIQSFLMKLPSLERVFGLESGYQDRATLINIFLGEFSQADNSSSDFDNVVKGNYNFEPEELRMYDVMFAHKFTNLKELEKSWIGYLNKEGSSSMKWSFVEFIMVETLKKLHNEREIRRIMGRRVNPVLNEPGTALGAADGLREFLRKKIANFQIKAFVLGDISVSNIGEKIRLGTSMIPDVLRDSGKVVLYMSNSMVVDYHKYNETMFGTNQDYKADLMYVKEYPSVSIIPIPNMGDCQRLIWTLEGNIKLFEHKPNEMSRFNFEQEDWKLKVWSQWKESIWAFMVGKKFASADQQDYDHQMIFCNEIDLPAMHYLKLTKDDVTPSVKFHSSLLSVANSEAKALTNLDDGTTGQEVRLKAGSTENGISIANGGNFVLSANWSPEKDDEIVLKKRADGKWVEMQRITASSGAIAFAADDTTPSVANGSEFITIANTEATAITNLDDADHDIVYTIFGGSDADSSTIANSGNFVLTEAMTLEAGTFIKLQKSRSNNKFYEIERG